MQTASLVGTKVQSGARNGRNAPKRAQRLVRRLACRITHALRSRRERACRPPRSPFCRGGSAAPIHRVPAYVRAPLSLCRRPLAPLALPAMPGDPPAPPRLVHHAPFRRRDCRPLMYDAPRDRRAPEARFARRLRHPHQSARAFKVPLRPLDRSQRNRRDLRNATLRRRTDAFDARRERQHRQQYHPLEARTHRPLALDGFEPPPRVLDRCRPNAPRIAPRGHRSRPSQARTTSSPEAPTIAAVYLPRRPLPGRRGPSR